MNNNMIFSFTAALIALVFLIYSLLNLQKLGITLTHPRVLVEFRFFLLFSTATLVILLS